MDDRPASTLAREEVPRHRVPGSSSSEKLGFIGSGLRELRERPRGQVPVLDALRSLAVLLVVAGHFSTDLAIDSRLVGASKVFGLAPFRFGWTGVDLFFILSGYLIGRQLWRELVGSGTVDVPRFVLRRGFRIWPLYFAFVAVTCLPQPHIPAWPDVLFVSNYVSGHVPGGWSLSTEEQFYIVVPVAVLLLRRHGPRLWVLLLPTLVGAVLIARAVTARALIAHGTSVADVKTVMYFPFHLRSEALFVGLLIALVSVLRPAWFSRPVDAGFSGAGFAVALACCALGGALRWASNVIFPFTGLALIFGGVTVFLLLDRSWISRLFDSHAFYLISRLSFGTYLNHLYVMGLLTPWLLRTVAGNMGAGATAGVISLGLITVCSLALAAVTFVLIEHPFLLLRSRFMRARAQSTIATSGATAGDLAVMS